MTDTVNEDDFKVEDCEAPSTPEECDELCKSNSDSIDQLVATMKSSC